MLTFFCFFVLFFIVSESERAVGQLSRVERLSEQVQWRRQNRGTKDHIAKTDHQQRIFQHCWASYHQPTTQKNHNDVDDHHNRR